MINYKKILLPTLLMVLLFVPVTTQALEVDYPTLPGPGPDYSIGPNSSLPDYLKYIAVFLMIISGAVAVVVLIFSGITYLVSTGDPKRVKAAVSHTRKAFTSILVILGAYAILNVVNPFLGGPVSPPPKEGVHLLEVDASGNAVEDGLEKWITSSRASLTGLKPGTEYKISFSEHTPPSELRGIIIYPEENFGRGTGVYWGENGYEITLSGQVIKSMYLDQNQAGIYLYEKSCNDIDSYRPQKILTSSEELKSLSVKCVEFRYKYIKDRHAGSGEPYFPDKAYGMLLQGIETDDEEAALVTPLLGGSDWKNAAPSTFTVANIDTQYSQFKINVGNVFQNDITKATVFQHKLFGNVDNYKGAVFYDGPAGEADVNHFSVEGDPNATNTFVGNYYWGEYGMIGPPPNHPNIKYGPSTSTDDYGGVTQIFRMEIPISKENYRIILANGPNPKDLGEARLFQQEFHNIKATSAGVIFMRHGGYHRPRTIVVIPTED